jgi:hypothetical protein
MRNLRRKPAQPALGRGRIQLAIERCFFFEADADGLVDGGTIVRYCQEWRYRCDGYRPSALNRLSVRNVLDRVAERVGRSRGLGRPWLWRLRNTDTERQE